LLEFENPRYVEFRTVHDERGGLGIVESSRHFGFVAKRFYFIFDNTAGQVRGSHAHKALRQFVMCLSGSVRLTVENPNGTFTFELDKRNRGVLIPPGCWRTLESFGPHTVVGVLASEEYDETDYIRDRDEYQHWLADQRRPKKVPYLPLDRQHAALHDELLQETERVLASGEFIGGDALAHFERDFAAFCQTRFALGCGNGLDALVLALEALGIGCGDEVIVPANSFVASALAISLVGATPVFCDADLNTYGLDLDSVRSKISGRTAAIMPVHLFGIPSDMDGLSEIATARGVKLVEDAAQAHGATYRGRRCGSLGDVGAFSFYPTKVLGALGDGGAVTTSNETIANKVAMMRNYGSHRKYHHEIRGRNSRLDTLQASFLKSKLTRLPRWAERRRHLVDLYQQNLRGIEWVITPTVPLDREPAWHVFPIRIEGRSRDEVLQHLASQGIQTNIHYPTPIHLQEAYRDAGYREMDFPAAEQASRQLLSLPLDPYHTDDEIYRVIEVLTSFGSRGRAHVAQPSSERKLHGE
jgi:dTDP-4-amino-4,6-dideoxygalactose transaminase